MDTTNPNDTYLQLRGYVDGDDPFMTGGHGVLKPRPLCHIKRRAEVPEWTKDFKLIQQFLEKRFPKLHSEPIDRHNASRWGYIIYQFFQAHETYKTIAWNLRHSRIYRRGTGLHSGTVITPQHIKSVVLKVRRYSRGLRVDGKQPTGRKPGRPKRTPKTPKPVV